MRVLTIFFPSHFVHLTFSSVGDGLGIKKLCKSSLGRWLILHCAVKANLFSFRAIWPKVVNTPTEIALLARFRLKHHVKTQDSCHAFSPSQASTASARAISRVSP